jgi:hypothetical protein
MLEEEFKKKIKPIIIILYLFFFSLSIFTVPLIQPRVPSPKTNDEGWVSPMSRGAFQGAVRDSQSTRVRQQKRASRRHREPIYDEKTLTQVAALVVDLELPDADWRLAPAVHRHEGPPVEASTGHVQTSPVQQGRSRAVRRGQVDLQITPPASC